MFDIDSGKLLIVAVLALIVIGPKDLPRVLRQVGQAVGRLRRMATEFQGQFMDAVKEADIADIRNELKELEKTAALDVNFDPARDIQAELTSAMAPLSSVSEATTSSPAEGFALPQIANDIEPDETGLAVEVAPSEPMPDFQSHGEDGTSTDEVVSAGPKRRILLKPHRSTFSIVRPDKLAFETGEAMTKRQRIVRQKKIEFQIADQP